jgi:hypothetical protein
VQLLIFLIQLPYPLLHGGERFANARLTVLFITVLRQPPPDRRIAVWPMLMVSLMFWAL